MQEEVDEVHVKDELFTYITHLAEQTRQSEHILMGLSPRGALAIVRMSKANAYVGGRDYLVPQDIADVFCEVAAHRLVLSPKARIAEMKPEDLLLGFFNTTPTQVKS